MRNVFDTSFSKITGLIPANLRRVFAPTADAIILEFDRHTVRPVVRIQGERTRARAVGDDEAGILELKSFISSEVNLPRLVLLRLPTSQVLHKHVVLPSATRRNLREVLAFEIDHETPFTREEVFWTYKVHRRQGRSGRLDVDLFLAPRSLIDPLIAKLRAGGIELSGIEVDAAAGAPVLIPLDTPVRGTWPRVDKPLRPFVAAVAGLAVLALAAPFLMQQWQLSSADSMISSLSGPAREAATLRQYVEQAARAADFLAKDRARNGSTIVTLAALTRALPDDTYLNFLSLQNGKATMSGMSPSAAGLIGVLAKAPGLSGPAFDAPVIQSADHDLESFTISVGYVPMAAP